MTERTALLNPMKSLFVFLASVLLVACAVPAAAQDWPMWRYDSARGAASPHSLPDELNPIWSNEYSRRVQTWDDPLNQDLMTYDRVFEPIVLDGRLFIGFNDRDKLTALDADTGVELWSFYAEGPVRLPPVGWKDRVFFCSDDGFLYCVDAKNGKLLWKFSGAPHSQHAIGNLRLTSAWPARGGPVVRDETVYFAASIWPFMGTFIYALDADSGEIRWVNDRTGSQYIKQPHSAPAFAGVAPQGALVATDQDLIVPGGRSVPAVLDRASGELRYFELNAGGKGTGGSFVAATDDHFYVHTRERGTRCFEMGKGVKTAFQVNEPVLQDDVVYAAAVADGKQVVRAYKDEKQIWQVEADGSGDVIVAGDKLYAAGADAIAVVQMPGKGRSPKVVQAFPVSGSIQRLIAADDKLFAVTLEGQIVAFGNGELSLDPADAKSIANAPLPKASGNRVDQLLSRVDSTGFALWYGKADSIGAWASASRSKFQQLAIIDSDDSSFDRVRQQLDAQGLYGRVTLHHSKPENFRAPQYIAHFVHVDQAVAESASDETIAQLYQSVRPYGGLMYVEGNDALADRIESLELEQAEIERLDSGVFVTRVGSLPGSADWTHQYGDISNSVKSNDSRVKLPLGVLWFGGSSNMDVLPRHGHGPPEQVVGGRLFIQGMNLLSARDVYTGRVLWKREFSDLGTFDVYYDDTYEDVPLDPKYNQVHIPGANARGTNYVVTEERVYIVEGNVCHALDPATGKTIAKIQLPKGDDGGIPDWGYIGVYEDVLIGGVGFANFRQRHGLEFPSDVGLKTNKKGFGSKSMDRAASVALIGFDRLSGKQLWRADAKHSFWHNGIVAGGGKIFCLDKNPQQIEDAMRRRGKTNPDTYRIVALDAVTGKPEWEINENIFGTWLGYSEKHNVLLQAGSKASDRLSTEAARGMAVYRGKNGDVVWQNNDLNYAGPCILHNELIITNANSYSESAGAFGLLTGKQRLVRNPLTGEMQPWKITRAYGCNNIIAAENFLTFRSGAAGFYDMLSESGTGNLGGFKSGCTSNLVVANGVLNAPDYTRTCSCSYQNQTSLALVHMPDMEMWSVSNEVAVLPDDRDISSLALNLGAPGDRRDANGLLWIEHPVVAGDSAPVDIRINSDATYFQSHSSRVLGSQTPWISASGVDGIKSLQIRLELKSPSTMKGGIVIEDSSDDAEESESGDVNLGSTDLELCEDGNAQLVGMRFNDVHLGRESKIRKAYIQFTCDETSSEATTLILTAEQTGNASAFESTKHDVSSRVKTKSEIGWKPKPWTKKGQSTQAHRTPDLSRLIREVIARPDWKPGNSMAFLLTGSGKRVASSSKAGIKKAPRLVIDADEVLPSDANRVVRTSTYDVTFHFACSPDKLTTRVFDVLLGDKTVLSDVTLDAQHPSVTRTLRGVSAADEMQFKFQSKTGQACLAGIEIRRNK
ncbi:PQQ-binding-like beta-propeller repeat protein [Stieleria marina]